MIFIDNKYATYYNNVIGRAQTRILPPEVYTEEHHIIPKSFFAVRNGWLDGNPDSPGNLVLLTAREHIFCHRMLARMTHGDAKQKTQNAEFLMLNRKYADGSLYRITSREYAKLQLEHSDRMRQYTTNQWENNTKRKEEQSNMMRGFWSVEEYKSAMETMSKNLWADTEYRKVQSTLRKDRWADPEHQALQNKSRKEVWADPEERSRRTGVNHPGYDHTIYTFKHKDGRQEVSTRNDLIQKYNLTDAGLSLLISRKLKSVKGWRLLFSG